MVDRRLRLLTVIGVSMVVFIIMRVLPGDPLLAIDPTLSVVGPALNDSRGPQHIGMVTYRRLDDLPANSHPW